MPEIHKLKCITDDFYCLVVRVLDFRIDGCYGAETVTYAPNTSKIGVQRLFQARFGKLVIVFH